uniref:Uncharacterized protein n=1 Tax=Candidatus Kentrum sp. DK TaxID=2126562 RepID=A0A450T281_9GAMM|nr:MAG: hypothetical protein BECKDK2373B_GA0170837_109317 [Candidatus Kentron sp. DK]
MTCFWHNPAFFSLGIHRIPFLGEMLGDGVTPVYKHHSPKGIDAVSLVPNLCLGTREGEALLH